MASRRRGGSVGRRALVAAFVLLAMACSGEAESEDATAASARFSPEGEGVVRDATTGLVWTARDSARELSWAAAERYCQELTLAAPGGGWRLATREELKSLYDPAQQQQCASRTCGIDPAIELTSPFQWSGTARGERRRVYIDFQHGSQLSPLIRPNLTRRVLCVRE